jgi:hypothetical protein
MSDLFRRQRRYVLRDGHPELFEGDDSEFAVLVFGGPDGNRVAYSEVEPDIRVSTIFLGLDHSRGGGEPVLFETMVFVGEEAFDQFRYHGIEDARAAHRLMVAEIMARREKANSFIRRVFKGGPEISADDPEPVTTLLKLRAKA